MKWKISILEGGLLTLFEDSAGLGVVGSSAITPIGFFVLQHRIGICEVVWKGRSWLCWWRLNIGGGHGMIYRRLLKRAYGKQEKRMMLY
jgi:hypothetical protein